MRMLKSFGRSPDAGPREINWRPFPMSAQADPAWDRCDLCLLYEFLVSNILSQPGAMHL